MENIEGHQAERRSIDESDILELIRRARSLEIQGDGDTARETYRQAGDLLSRLYWRYFSILAWESLPPDKKHLAQDIAQDVCLETCRSLPGFDERRGAKLKTWMIKIFYHCRIDAVKRDIRQHGPNPMDTIPPTVGDRLAEKALVEKRMSQLPERERVIIAMYAAGMTSKEIAKNHGLTDANVRKIIERSLAVLNGENHEAQRRA